MKKILLLGDSIRMGYDRYVKMAFDGVAEVYYPNDNCRFTGYIIRHLPDWKAELSLPEDVDLVHFNAGLWDDLVMLDGKHHTALPLYEENLGRICDIITILFPKAKIVFATTTYVQEHLFKRHKRYNADTERYNETAKRVMAARGIPVNDIGILTKDMPVSYYSDLTHLYTKDGTRLLAEPVIHRIADMLALTPKPLDYDALFRETEKVIGV